MIVKINVSKPASYRDDSGGGGKLAENHLGNIFTFLPLTFRQVGSENRRHGPLSFFLPVQYLSPFSLLGKFSIACLGGKWDLPLTTKLKMPGVHYRPLVTMAHELGSIPWMFLPRTLDLKQVTEQV